MLFYRRQVLVERKLFHVKSHSWGLQTWRTFLGGLVAGIGVSVVVAFLGISLSLEAIICIWVTSLILMLFHIRYLCFAYSIGLLGIIQFVLGWFPNWRPEGWISHVITTIVGLDIPALALSAVLHFAEALLVKIQGSGFATPLFLEEAWQARWRLSYAELLALALVPACSGGKRRRRHGRHSSVVMPGAQALP